MNDKIRAWVAPTCFCPHTGAGTIFNISVLSVEASFETAILIFLMFIFERERESTCVCKWGKGRERGRHRIRNRLQALSCQHRA